MQQPSRTLAFLIEYLDLAAATGVSDASWELHQIQFLNDESILTADVKSRQIGWSFNAALDAVAHSCVTPRLTNIFLSVTQTEANEKIRYANHVWEALDGSVRPKKIVDNRTEIEFDNGSRIISHPCRPPRGKARARVYPDEIAHYPRDDEIYTALVPIITRGGVIRMGSSPLGARGVFWEIVTQALNAYPGYGRRYIPWWATEALCTDIKDAVKLAPYMPTYERVYEFGNQRLQLIFENMPLEDFQQEYECAWADESIAWITWEEIKRNQEYDRLGQHEHVLVEVSPDNTLGDALGAIDRVAELIQERKIGNSLSGGMDVGRKKNKSEIFFIEDTNDRSYPVRLGITLDRLEFADQETVVAYALDTLPVNAFLIDDTGLGMQFAEDFEASHPWVAEGITFSAESKKDMAVEMKLRFQQRRAPIPLDRDLGYQIHSVKKIVSSSNRILFDADRNEKHHADKFWALALAHAATTYLVGFAAGRGMHVGHRG